MSSNTSAKWHSYNFHMDLVQNFLSSKLIENILFYRVTELKLSPNSFGAITSSLGPEILYLSLAEKWRTNILSDFGLLFFKL